MLSNTCCMNWKGHPWGSHPSQPTAQVLKVVKIAYALHACSWRHSPACGFPREPHTREQRGTRTGQSLSQTEHFLGCFLLATTGTDHFPRKLLRFLVLIFFFSIFIVRSERMQWYLAATFHQRYCYCYCLVVGICFPSGETQRRCPCLEEYRVKETPGEILPNAMHDVTLKISWMW